MNPPTQPNEHLISEAAARVTYRGLRILEEKLKDSNAIDPDVVGSVAAAIGAAGGLIVRDEDEEEEL